MEFNSGFKGLMKKDNIHIHTKPRVKITLLWFCTREGKTTHFEIDGSKNFPNNRPLNFSIFNLIMSFPNTGTLPHFPRPRQVPITYDVRYY